MVSISLLIADLGKRQQPKRNSIRSGNLGSSEESGSKVKLVAILNPFDKKMKELRTLKQHYYPEGGWGWVIVLVTLCVQVISHGLQFALAMYVMSVPKSSVISRRLLNASFDQSGNITTKNSLLIRDFDRLLRRF